MAKDEFSVNELEPVRNTDVADENTAVEQEEVVDSVQYEDDASNDGPTIKEVIVNSVNPDYQGPTAKEIIVNSVKVDNTKRKNMAGLIVLIVVLTVIGFIVFLDMSSEDKQAKEPDYFSDLPKWATTYKEYFNDYAKDRSNFDLVFLDLDFDDKAEAIVKYIENDNVNYEVVDLLDEEEVSFTYSNVSDVIMMYSFTFNKVTWYMDTSLEDGSLYLVDLAKRLNSDADYELHLDYDALMEFKSDHFNISYSASYTKISFRTCDKNLAQAILLYEQENKEIDKLVNGVIKKYSNVI